MKKRIITATLCALALAQPFSTIQAQNGVSTAISSLSSDKISQALKLALDKGITDQVSKLTNKDGFYKNDLVKIMLPQEIQQIDKTLRKMGLGTAADQGLLLINRAAETAVKQATPIFIDAVKQMSFKDATSILLGDKDAATTYLKKATSQNLQAKFAPIIQESLNKVGADAAWQKLTTAFNKLPLKDTVNTNLTDYVTQQTMEGVFKMIAVEESNIRQNIKGARDSDLLEQVFAVQDKTTNTENTNITNKTTEQNDKKSSKILNIFNRLGKN